MSTANLSVQPGPIWIAGRVPDERVDKPLLAKLR